MTIIDERAQDTRAKRRIGQPFRRDGGPFPVEHRETFTSNRTHEGIRATMMDRDYSRAHLCKLRLPFLAVFRHFLSLPGVIPSELLLIPSEFLPKNGGNQPFLPGSVGITFFRFLAVSPLQYQE